MPPSRGMKRMKKVLYIDMDGVLNLFEHDPDARTNMWKDGYFHDISPRENIESDLIMLSGYFDEIVILTKCIARDGVKAEKREICRKAFITRGQPVHGVRPVWQVKGGLH